MEGEQNQCREIRVIVNALLCEFFSFLLSAKNYTGTMKNGWGGAGGEVKEFIFYLEEI